MLTAFVIRPWAFGSPQSSGGAQRSGFDVGRSTFGVRHLVCLVLLLAGCVPAALAQTSARRNIVFILTDDHRYDALGVMGHPLARTPNMDALAKGGAHMRNAFVTTALCSPSRASILTGTYAHTHGVVDNFTPIPPGLPNVGQLLKQAGYQTALMGKWHIGDASDAPQPGFDRWVSFRGQGDYLPRAGATMINVDGQRVPQTGYITDELTDYALDWLGRTTRDKPFFLYLSHKGVHANFDPAERHKGSLKDVPVPSPQTIAPAAAEAGRLPTWVRNQRNSWHGVEFPYHSTLDVAEYYRRYMETLRAVDDSVGRVVEWLRKENLLESTLIVYMGDNGFAFGEHGLIDKRTAFDWSMRVPMLVYAPGLVAPGQQIDRVVANIDIAPTMLDLAGAKAPAHMQGMSMLPVLRDAKAPWRDTLLYEYYWEWSFPQTPTQFALRGERYKYVFTHGVWDVDMFFDLQADPQESRNLIDDPAHAKSIATMRTQLFETLEKTGGLKIPIYPVRGGQQNLRNPNGSEAQPFPKALISPRKTP
jgi:N-acetylglucosamine-6-sulfatase